MNERTVVGEAVMKKKKKQGRISWYLLHELSLGAIDGGERARNVLSRLTHTAPALEADVTTAARVWSKDLNHVELVVVLANVCLQKWYR